MGWKKRKCVTWITCGIRERVECRPLARHAWAIWCHPCGMPTTKALLWRHSCVSKRHTVGSFHAESGAKTLGHDDLLKNQVVAEHQSGQAPDSLSSTLPLLNLFFHLARSQLWSEQKYTQDGWNPHRKGLSWRKARATLSWRKKILSEIPLLKTFRKKRECHRR